MGGADDDVIVENLQSHRIFTGDHLIEHLTGSEAQACHVLLGELAEIGHPLILAHLGQDHANESGRGSGAGTGTPRHFAFPFRIEQILQRLWRAGGGNEIGVEARRQDIGVGRDPISFSIHIFLRQTRGILRHPFQKEILFLQHRRRQRSFDDVSLHLAGFALVDHAQGDVVGLRPHIIDLDPVFLFEDLRQRQHEFIDDLRRIPGDVAFFRAAAIKESSAPREGNGAHTASAAATPISKRDRR